MTDHRVRVDNGKYTFRVPADDYAIQILRYGESWHWQTEAHNAIHSLMCELDAARVVVQAVRDGIGGLGLRTTMARIAAALARHDSLTPDREPPSAWCGVEASAGRPDANRLNTPAAETSSIAYWKEGTRLVEECLTKARNADPDDVPFPLSEIEGKLWHQAQAAAYQHALEMMGWTESVEPSSRPDVRPFADQVLGLHDVVYNIASELLADREPRWSVTVHRDNCNLLAKRVIEEIGKAWTVAPRSEALPQSPTASDFHSLVRDVALQFFADRDTGWSPEEYREICDELAERVREAAEQK